MRDEYFYRRPQRGSYEFSAREERIYGPPCPPPGGSTDRGETQTQEKTMQTTYLDIYSDPISGREFGYRIGDNVWDRYGPDRGIGVICERGRRMMYEHIYLVRFHDGSTTWISEENLVPD